MEILRTKARRWQALACVAALALAGLPAVAAEPSPAAPAADDREVGFWGFHEPRRFDFDDHKGFHQIFDGASLKGWDGDPQAWKIEAGAIVAEVVGDKPFNNAYLTYRAETALDFDLKLEVKVEKGGGAGIQYRSQTDHPWPRKVKDRAPPNAHWMLTGPQADFWYPIPPQAEVFTGQLYAENSKLGILAWRGEVTQAGPGETPRLVGAIQDRRALGGYVKVNDWNQYEIIARGGVLMHFMNGQLMAVFIDDDPRTLGNQPGLIGLESEGAPSKISYRNIWLKVLR
jgi:hypothetical protein